MFELRLAKSAMVLSLIHNETKEQFIPLCEDRITAIIFVEILKRRDPYKNEQVDIVAARRFYRGKLYKILRNVMTGEFVPFTPDEEDLVEFPHHRQN